MANSEKPSSSRNPLTWSRLIGQTASFALGELALNRIANSFSSGLDSLKESLSLKELLPNLDVLLTMSNFKTALLAIHLGASAIDFPDQTTHPNKHGFVRTVAAFDNFLHHEPDSIFPSTNFLHKTVQNIINFTAPVAIHTAPNLIFSSADILRHKEEHPNISNALVALGVMGGLHFLYDVLKITAKYIEKKSSLSINSTKPEKNEGKKPSRIIPGSFGDPVIVTKKQPKKLASDFHSHILNNPLPGENGFDEKPNDPKN